MSAGQTNNPNDKKTRPGCHRNGSEMNKQEWTHMFNADDGTNPEINTSGTGRFAHLVAKLMEAQRLLEAPCPSWCTSGPHPYTADSMSPTEFYRNHRVFMLDGRVEVTVEQGECLDNDGLRAETPSVTIVGDTQDMDLQVLTALSDALTQATTALAGILGGAR